MRQFVYTNKRPEIPGRYRYRYEGIGIFKLNVVVYEELGRLYGVFLDDEGSKVGTLPIDKTDPRSEWARVGGII